MKYTTRSLFLLITAVASIFGCIEIYQWLFHRHCQSLKPALFAFVLSDEGAVGLGSYPDKFFFGVLHKRSLRLSEGRPFALGRDSNQMWIDPTESLLELIDLPHLKPASCASDGKIIHYISNVVWLDWNTVKLDYGTFGFEPPVDIGATLIVAKTADSWEWRNPSNTGWIRNATLEYPPKD